MKKDAQEKLPRNFPGSIEGHRILKPHLGALRTSSASDYLLSTWPSVADRDVYPSRIATFAAVFENWPKLSLQDAKNLSAVAGGSAFLMRYLQRHPNDLICARVLSNENAAPPETFEDLRRKKYQTMLSLFCSRIHKTLPIQKEWGALSTLADKLISDAFQIAIHEEEKAPFENGVPIEIFALGKLGAHELNVSSDIDLIYTGHPSEKWPAQNLLRIAEQHIQSLSKVTEEGFCYRVDTRLRPMGIQGELVQPAQSLLRYYESMGKTWERAVWLRGRSAFCSESQPSELRKLLQPFIFKRHLDYGTLDDLREMKLRIDAAVRISQDTLLDIKLGPGGIREIEFIAQAFQLIYGGTAIELQGSSTLSILNHLADRSFLKKPIAENLIQAYQLFRSVEHAVQWEDERQTHRIPKLTDKESWRQIQSRCPEFPDIESTIEDLRDQVHEQFEKMFLPERHPKDTKYFDVRFDDPSAPSRLAELLTSQTSEEIQPFYERLRDAVPRLKLTARGERHFRRLLPVLMEQLLQSPDPTEALDHFLVFLTSTRARSVYYATLADNPATLRLLFWLFSTAEYLTSIFHRHPELMDALILRTHQLPATAPEVMDREIETTMQESRSREESLNALRRIKREHVLRIAVHDLAGEIGWEEVTKELTLLADKTISAALQISGKEIHAKNSPSLAVIGMGSLGAGEMGYASDVDLLFLFSPDIEEEQEQREQAIRWSQKLISAISLASEEGSLYQVDTRLRPSGNQGLLVTSLAGFKRYHETGAALWERQALLRARPVAGSPKVMEQFRTLREEICFERYDPEVTAVATMRERLENELAQESNDLRDVKLGRGGLADVEFLIAALQLRFGKQHASLRGTFTLGLIDECKSLEILTPMDARTLSEGYLFLRHLENRLRLQANRPISKLSLEKKYLMKVARGFSLGPQSSVRSAEDLEAGYRMHTEKIRETFDRLAREV